MLGTGAVTELLNPPEAPADLEAPFSGWAEIFAEVSGRCLILTHHLCKELFGLLHQSLPYSHCWWCQ